jgi:hypothetical protein
VNIPRSRDRYRHKGVDQRFAELLDKDRPRDLSSSPRLLWPA